MIDVDLRRYGTDEEYKQFINGYISGADIDEMPIECQLVRSVKEATDAEKYIKARLEFIRRNATYGLNFGKDYERLKEEILGKKGDEE